ncbi:hypothetical protein LCGC14_0415630 [marine sediment metagenome]|uniref:IrrE N-terminal-like domain-containing protein n=1 Tax=marine sediment metagenome TaxID=412755 RepID=A0A0F9TAD2_9ZZZZ
MAMIEYKYQPATMEQLTACIRWCQNQMQLRDWLIKLDTSIAAPPEVKLDGDDNGEDAHARVEYSTDTLKAVIWVPLARMAESNRNPIECLIHELCHIMIEARGVDAEDESLVRVISPMIYRLYCKENRIKQAREK